MTDISPQDLKAKLDRREPLVLLDVRDDWETALCRLDNATHIPTEEIEFRTAELDPARGVGLLTQASVLAIHSKVDATSQSPLISATPRHAASARPSATSKASSARSPAHFGSTRPPWARASRTSIAIWCPATARRRTT